MHDDRYESSNNLEGYDYEFVPSLDNKHMCPICLNALRDPVQTECGHRFCQPCLQRSMQLNKKCPVDNVELKEGQIFLDHFACREVLDLIAKCKNKGCDHICELRLISSHEEVCTMRKIPCKNKCGLDLLPQDAIFHEEKQCPRRPVTCDICGRTYPFSSEESHKEECQQHQSINCPHCMHELKQYKLQNHITTECLQAPIKCVFEKVGCQQELPRHKLQRHMEESTQIHLQYLLSSVSNLTGSAKEVTTLLEGLKLKVKHSESSGNIYETADSNIEIYDRDGSGLSNGYGNMPGYQSRMPKSPDDDRDEIDMIKEFNNMVMENEQSHAGAGPSTLLHESVIGPDAEEKIISLDHQVRELAAKMDTQIKSVRDLTAKMDGIEQRMLQQELKCCNGLYFWKIREYSKLRKAATMGEVTVLHSPGFYTSPHGYRICIRVNLNGVETAQGTHLSLFVHLMKGDNDDLLFWPFAGIIILTVINQRDLPQDRSHISETLQAKTNLMAFQRPVSERNQKGYGYIDFFPLNMLEKEGFIKNDTLIIKAQVRVDPPGNNIAT